MYICGGIVKKDISPKYMLMMVDLSFVLLFTEVVEHLCSITSLQLGETLPGIAKDMETYTMRVPIGVCAGITP